MPEAIAAPVRGGRQDGVVDARAERFGDRRTVELQEIAEEVFVHVPADDGTGPEDANGGRVEDRQPREQDVADRDRQRAPTRLEGHQLLDVERVALGAIQDRLDHVRFRRGAQLGDLFGNGLAVQGRQVDHFANKARPELGRDWAQRMPAV